MEQVDQFAAEGDVPGLVLVVDPVDAADRLVQPLVLGHRRVEVVDQLLEDQDAGEHQQALDLARGAGRLRTGRLRTGRLPVDLPAVAEAEFGEEPHVLVLLTDEMVEELRRRFETGGVDPADHLDEQFSDAVHIEAVEIDALVLGKRVELLRTELLGPFRPVGGGELGAHPPHVLGEFVRPLEQPVRVVVVVDRLRGEPVQDSPEPVVSVDHIADHRAMSPFASGALQ